MAPTAIIDFDVVDVWKVGWVEEEEHEGERQEASESFLTKKMAGVF
jgi:hypothetical protein